MRAVVFTGSGGNEVVSVLELEDPPIASIDVLVDVAVAGVNPADLHQREGHYPAPPGIVQDIPGLEVAGTVAAIGQDVTRWRAGDRVFGLVGGGGLADRVLAREDCVTQVPARLTDDEAAAVPEAFITAHDALRQGGIQAGETVFVSGSTGAVGSAAMQIAVALGATAIDAREDAEPGGVDVLIELVGGHHVAEDLDLIAVGGRIVVVSVAAGSHTDLDLLRLMTRRATIKGTVLRARSPEQKANAVRAFEDEVVPLLADGTVRPSIDSVWPVQDVHRAFDRLGERGKNGKVLVRFGDPPVGAAQPVP